MDRPPPTGAAPLDSARALGASFLALLGTRVDLVWLELEEEAGRRKHQLLLACIAAVFLACGLLLLAFLVVVLFWDTYRVAAIAGVTLAYLGIGAWAFLRLRTILRDSPPPFSATLAEFRNDMQMIRGSDDEPR